MNKLNLALTSNNKKIFSIYFTAGFPKLNDTVVVLKELLNNGVGMIEIGMPFSDPLADGPVIQDASEIALSNGMSIKLLFEQLKTIKETIIKSDVPVLLMGYINPVLRYGVEKFCKDAAALGVSGVILPDLPLEEYLEKYKDVFERERLSNVFLITPQTSVERIWMIDDNSNGFIYMVSSSSTTGTKTGMDNDKEIYFKRIQEMNLKNPTLIGFGINTKETFQTACKYGKGAIVGTAFVSELKQTNDIPSFSRSFINKYIS